MNNRIPCLLSLLAACTLHASPAPKLLDPPVAGFSFYIEFVGTTAETSFSNESTDADTYYWDFGDGYSSTDINPFHAYTIPGIYFVCLTAYNDDGSDTYCDTIVSYITPGALWTYSGDPAVTFSDLSTGAPTTWHWEFGDGDTSNEVNPVHTYAVNGDYLACELVSNPGGSSNFCQTITIASYVATVADFSWSGDPEVSFTDLSTLDPFSWSWDFGDGSSSTLEDPVHSFPANGSYYVCLTATNAGGTDTFCDSVFIDSYPHAPVADFSYTVLVNCGAVQFTDLSTNMPDSWTWSFPGGDIDLDQNPVITLSEDYIDNANVCLTAANSGGSDTVCKMVEWCILSAGNMQPAAIQISPDPARNFCALPMACGEIELFGTDGRSYPVPVQFAQGFTQLDVQDIPPGIYLLKCIGIEGTVFTGKLCVVH